MQKLIAFLASVRYNNGMIIYAKVDYDHIKTENAMPDDINYQPHFHEKYELLYIIDKDGETFYNIGGARYSLQAGDLVLIKPGTLHNLQIEPNVKYDRIVMYFSKEDIKPEQRGILDSSNSLYHIQDGDGLKKIFDVLLQDEVLFSKEEFTLCLKDTLNLIVAHLKYSYKEENSTHVLANETISRILDYIDDNITKPLDADIITKEFFISKSWLSHTFKKYLNISLKKYINQKKLIHIERLIATGLPITKAVESFSYENYTTFFCQYKQYTNKKPLDNKKSPPPSSKQ